MLDCGEAHHSPGHAKFSIPDTATSPAALGGPESAGDEAGGAPGARHMGSPSRLVLWSGMLPIIQLCVVFQLLPGAYPVGNR